MTPDRGLIVREPWISMLLDGRKTWELRGSRTSRRGVTGLIGSGTGRVLGEACLVGVVGPLTREALAANVHRHGVEADWETLRLPYRNVYAWEFVHPSRYPLAVRYEHKAGAVIWVKLGASSLENPL